MFHRVHTHHTSVFHITSHVLKFFVRDCCSKTSTWSRVQKLFSATMLFHRSSTYGKHVLSIGLRLHCCCLHCCLCCLCLCLHFCCLCCLCLCCGCLYVYVVYVYVVYVYIAYVYVYIVYVYVYLVVVVLVHVVVVHVFVHVAYMVYAVFLSGDEQCKDLKSTLSVEQSELLVSLGMNNVIAKI